MKSLIWLAVVLALVGAWIWVAPDTARFRRGLASDAQLAAARRATQLAGHVDWSSVGIEATRDLTTYLRFDTSNPPGDERDAAEWLASRLNGAGIDARVEEWAPGRFGMIARVPGRGACAPLILAHHIDVVPPGDEKWDHEPFAGEIVDGEIWGRGAIDDKGPGMMQIAAIIELHRRGIKLDRDVIVLGVPDEEAGGQLGMKAALEKHPELARAEFALIGEPSFIFPIEGQTILPVAVAEKGSVALGVTFDGHGGHASIPGPRQPLPVLASAMDRLASEEQPVRWQPEPEEMFGRLGARLGGLKGWVLQRLSNPLVRRAALPALARDPGVAAMLRDTVAWTGLRSWVRYNVIPGRAEAMIDMRLLPGSDPDRALDHIREALEIPEAKIDRFELKAGNRSSFRTTWFGAIEATSGSLFPDATVVPLLAPGSSDARHLRAAGVTTYLASPAHVDRELLETAHGRNERLPVAAIGEGARFVYTFLLVAGGGV